jgi:L-asparagine transporter-like permease
MDSEKKEKEYNKWKSRRWLITVWAMIVVTAIVVLGTIFNNDTFATLATTLVAVPVGFVSLETLNKKHYAENERAQNVGSDN